MARRFDYVGENGHVEGVMSGAGYVPSKLAARRATRLKLLWEIVNRTWDEYLRCPSGVPQGVWDAITVRFGMCDLVSPTLNAIVSAMMGGKITLRVQRSYSGDRLTEFLDAADWPVFRRAFAREACLYGTAAAECGFDEEGDPSFALLPTLITSLRTEAENARVVTEALVSYGGFAEPQRARLYTREGVYRKGDNGEAVLIPGTDYGFLPVCVAKGQPGDASSPYGESLVWPAAEESRQITFLQNDIVVLARTQSFSTRVVQGRALDSKAEENNGPFQSLRLDPDDQNAKAYFISPDAKISELDALIDAKYERTAAQCGVPVEIFRQAKSGTNQAAGAALLTHKPLFDLVCTLQDNWRRVELDMLARVDALLLWQANGGAPVSLRDVRRNLQAEVVFERESNPAMNLQDAQTFKALVDEGFVDFSTARAHFNPDDDDDAAEAAEARHEERMTLPAVVF